ncbi:MAG: hypothetical protein U0441_39105 [Polyangiaceae bacterium]
MHPAYRQEWPSPGLQGLPWGRCWRIESGKPLPAVHGVVTTGSNWRFLRLEGSLARIDNREYYLQQIGSILGILCHIVRAAAAAQPRAE